MCRWVAYRGKTLFLEDIITKPAHSLIDQSLHATEAKAVTNGDGFGLGWYGARPEPGLYREIQPAWSDENLRSLVKQVSSHLFFAHVRASTGTATIRANCHPFVKNQFMFMHNGQIGHYHDIRRALESTLPDALFDARQGSTDSELIFLMMLFYGAQDDPIGALSKTLSAILRELNARGLNQLALRVSACFSNGRDIFAFRWATDNKPPSLYYQDKDGDLLIVSEPLDNARDTWVAVPQNQVLIAKAGEAVLMQAFDISQQIQHAAE